MVDSLEWPPHGMPMAGFSELTSSFGKLLVSL